MQNSSYYIKDSNSFCINVSCMVRGFGWGGEGGSKEGCLGWGEGGGGGGCVVCMPGFKLKSVMCWVIIPLAGQSDQKTNYFPPPKANRVNAMDRG
jgi:hypothetical protein